MTPERVYKFYRAYKLYFQGSYDFTKYKGNIKTPSLLSVPERRFYHRISQKLDDAQVHALFALAFFHDPKMYVATLASDAWFKKAVTFASRGENGLPMLEADSYKLASRLPAAALDEWLYGEILSNGRGIMPECMSDVIAETLPLDLAAALLLIPQAHLHYHWVKAFTDIGPFGVIPYIDRLRKVDQILYMQRPGWRTLSHPLARRFWDTYAVDSLAPKVLATPGPSLF
jgi:hypothetical protein